MPSKHVHLYPGTGFLIKDQSRQKFEIWNKSLKRYYVGNQVNKNT